jgi:hypothetical protein
MGPTDLGHFTLNLKSLIVAREHLISEREGAFASRMVIEQRHALANQLKSFTSYFKRATCCPQSCPLGLLLNQQRKVLIHSNAPIQALEI